MLRSKILQFVILPILLTCIAVSGAVAQENTKVNDVKASRMLLGRHMLSLQWISWDIFGGATVTGAIMAIPGLLIFSGVVLCVSLVCVLNTGCAR